MSEIQSVLMDSTYKFHSECCIHGEAIKGEVLNFDSHFFLLVPIQRIEEDYTMGIYNK